MTDLKTESATLEASPARLPMQDHPLRPFRVEVPDEALADLRRRLQATRWPTRELVEDRSQGVQLATLQELARYWSTEYDWRKGEAKLNAFPQFTTAIDGVRSTSSTCGPGTRTRCR
jgi:hypothetical protein